jgi:hypothetical protein
MSHFSGFRRIFADNFIWPGVLEKGGFPPSRHKKTLVEQGFAGIY